jgi:hypothetical protein
MNSSPDVIAAWLNYPESLLAGALLVRNELAQVVLALLHTLLQILLAVLQGLDLLLHKQSVTTVSINGNL